MSNLSSLTAKQLNQAAKIKEEIEALTIKLTELWGAAEEGAPVVKRGRKKSKFSAAGIAKIRAGQKARWAKINSAKSDALEAATPVRKKRKMSAAGRARIVAAQKARWAKVKAEKKD